MRSLILRACVWMMLASIATAMIGRFYFELVRMEEAREQVSLLLNTCLDDLLVELEQAPPSARPDVLAAHPSVAAFARLEDSDALPSTLEPSVVADRPIWASRGNYWVGLSGEQLLLLRPVTPPGQHPIDPFFLLGTILVMSFLTSVAIIAPVARRLGRLTRASRQVAQGDLRVRVNDTGRDAVGDLSRQFDAMTESIAQQQREREAFFHAVAHELSTPLSRMELALALLEMDESADERHQRVSALHTELEELTGLTAELLEWVEADRSRPVERTAFDAVVVLGQIVDRNQRPGLSLTLQGDTRAPIEAEERSFRRALDNVIRNAARYAAGTVVVTVSAGEGQLDVTIEDDGPGIAPADRTRIFEPFVRLDPSRDRRSGGAGLGLSIVQRILARHQGQAWVSRSQQLGGAAFVLRWPTAAEVQ